jgi:hypothetical protein
VAAGVAPAAAQARFRDPKAVIPADGQFYSVAATSATNAWAVGTLNSDAEVVVLGWNGTIWKNSPVPFVP